MDLLADSKLATPCDSLELCCIWGSQVLGNNGSEFVGDLDGKRFYSSPVCTLGIFQDQGSSDYQALHLAQNLLKVRQISALESPS